LKAVLHTRYGPPELLELAEVEKPTPKPQQVLVKVRASSINAAEYRTMRANPFPLRLMIGGMLRPKDPRFGSDLAGRVEAVGEQVTLFRPGDEVFGVTAGAFAEYAITKETNVARKPANRSFEEAAALPVAALTALQGLRDAAGLRAGQEVLIQGASGGVGTFAIQLAKLFGAEVTAVCRTRNLDMARSMGADHVIDYTVEDFTRSSPRYDVIFAVNGYHPIRAYQRALKREGVYICAGGTILQFVEAMGLGRAMSRKGGQRLGGMGIAKVIQNDLVYLGELLEAGKLVPWIDRRYPLSQVPAAIRYVEQEHARGKVVITMDDHSAADPA
jgi:NADPH:quinone reductase-like Zn-dependent oxidoreductase